MVGLSENSDKQILTTKHSDKIVMVHKVVQEAVSLEQMASRKEILLVELEKLEAPSDEALLSWAKEQHPTMIHINDLSSKLAEVNFILEQDGNN